MQIATATKQQLVEKFGRNAKDTGSSETQIALLTQRIVKITEHMKQFPKDLHTRYGLVRLVSQRRKMLKYLKKQDLKRYAATIKSLNLRDTF